MSDKQEEALLSVVITDVQPNAPLIHIRLKGLDKEAFYRMEVRTDMDEGMLSVPDFPGGAQLLEYMDQKEKCLSGAALMNGGITLPWIMGNYPAVQIGFRKVTE